MCLGSGRPASNETAKLHTRFAPDEFLTVSLYQPNEFISWPKKSSELGQSLNQLFPAQLEERTEAPFLT